MRQGFRQNVANKNKLPGDWDFIRDEVNKQGLLNSSPKKSICDSKEVFVTSGTGVLKKGTSHCMHATMWSWRSMHHETGDRFTKHWLQYMFGTHCLCCCRYPYWQVPPFIYIESFCKDLWPLIQEKKSAICISIPSTIWMSKKVYPYLCSLVL